MNVNEQENPLISVIIPVYNVENYIDGCIESIRNQSYSNLEIILVDDGSTDKSGKICDYYATLDKRITVIHQKNMGLSGARNSGIDIANGMYIGMVDSDDYIKKDMYEQLLRELRNENADMAFCSFIRQIEKTGQMQYLTGEYQKQIFDRQTLYEALFEKKYVVILPVAWNKLYKRAVFEGVRYPIGKIHEDEFAIHEIIGKTNRAVFVPVEGYVYNIRNSGITGQKNLKHIMQRMEAFQERMYYFKEKKLISLYKKQAEFCIRNIILECKQLDMDEEDAAEFVKEMASRVKNICWKEEVSKKNKAKYFLFSYFPFLYIRKRR